MRKNILFSLFAMAALLFATSCQNEELFGGANVDTEVVSYTISTQELGTRADDGPPRYKDYKLYWGVYEHVSKDQGTSLVYVDAISADKGDEKAKNIEHGQVQVDIQLAKQKTYTIVFWAQHAENPMCVVDWDDRKVSFAQSLEANQKTYDAFWACDKDVTLNGASQKTVKLVRPFAQINIGAGDFAEFVAASGENTAAIVKSAIEVKNVPLGMDIETGDIDAYTETSTMTFAASDTLPSTEKFPVNGNQYIALGYVLADTNQILVDIKLTYTDEKGKTYSNEFTNVPVKRNHRTNIYGNLLTGNAGYDVDVDDSYDDGDNNVEVVEVATASDLQETIGNMKDGDSLTIVLTDNIDLGALFAAANGGNTGSNAPALRAAGIESQGENEAKSLILAAGRSLTLDLNGKTLKQEVECTGSYSMIVNNGTLTVTGNGKISFKDLSQGGGDTWGSYTIENHGTLTVENGTIEHLGDASLKNNTNIPIQNYKGKVVVNDGIISSPTFRSLRDFTAGGEIIINGGQFLGQVWMQGLGTGSSSLTINGGEFNPTDGYDKSSVYITNGTNDIIVAITGGTFNTKIGCADATKSGVKGAITGGQFKVDPSEYVADGYPVNAPETEGGYYTIGEFTPVATVGGEEYGSLRAAIAAVEDGGTITMIADEVFTEYNRVNNGGDWYEGLLYDGDKSFTLDLGGNTLSQNGAVNDYLLYFKNNGAKANTITLKNGTVDAGTTAFAAIATASSNAQKITMNLEKISINGNKSGGAVVKFRGGGELNVKDGTVITGEDNYCGIEAVGNNTVVNVYEGAEIYQNGTTGDVGAIIGASYNATLNIYGGKGKSAKCGIIVMSTGATINVSGGEWTANGDGTVAAGNNGVLVSQNNRYETGWACKSVLNVTGGTFKGGYDCWGMGPGQEPDDAQINIKGGNFNADPENYVVAGYEATENAGTYTVDKSAALKELEAALANGGNVTLTKDVTLLESIKVENKVTLDLNGKTITAPTSSAFEVKTGGELTVKNGKVVAYESTVRAIGGKVVVESGEYTSTGTAVDSPSTNRYSLDSREGGEIVINGGTFKSNNGMINVSSTVTINGGKFENIVEKSTTRHFAYVSALLTINDGEFYGKANSSAGGNFFCGAAETGNIQVNGGKFTSLWTSGSVNGIFGSYYGGAINVTGGLFNSNGGIADFVTENTDEATKAAYPYVAK